ncbi:MAG: hypothetical protein SF066_08415, partial [Thermoanaerobaculia bacterium]|nr:hypothetical protein [Thermoanaerobaculia bacterium]
DEEGLEALHSKTAFLEPNQRISRNLTGCSSTFIPFGAIQARRTGLQAAELLLTALNADKKPKYKFWVGPGTAAAKEGLRTTSWWKAAATTPDAEATLRVFGRPCGRCRGGQ